MVHGRQFLKICSDMKILWYSAELLLTRYIIFENNNENFKMEVEKTNFVTRDNYSTKLLYYLLARNPSVKIWSNKFQMVIMINYSKLCASL